MKLKTNKTLYCQLYVPALYRSYGKDALKMANKMLWKLKSVGFGGVYLISLWKDGGYDNGFDIVEYSVNPKFGTDIELLALIQVAHDLGMEVGVDVVPHHVSDLNTLARGCINGTLGFSDCLYVVSEDEAMRLTEAGVPSFFGEHAYSRIGGKYVRSTFADYHQLDLNWNSAKVQEYFRQVFRRLKGIGVDFARIDCGMMLLEDVSRADPRNPLGVLNPKESVQAVRAVAGGMKLFFEWFDPASGYMFENMPECYALDCSFVLTGEVNTHWNHPKMVPLLGGHDQMTVADRGLDHEELIDKLLVAPGEYGFLDIQTLIGWKTEPGLQSGDQDYDADPANPNERYRVRRGAQPIIWALYGSC